MGVLPCYYLNWAWSAWRRRGQWAGPGTIMAGYPVFSDLVLGYALTRGADQRLIVDFRDDFSGVMTRGWRRILRRAYQWLEGKILKRADAVTVTTEKLREDLVARHGLDPDKVATVYNIVPPAGPRPPGHRAESTALKVIYAGAMSAVQKPEILLKAYAWLQWSQPEIAQGLAVEFYGPESHYFKWHIRQHFGGGSQFHGFCDREQIAAELARTDIGFLSLADATYAYATPTKLFEYIEFGIPIVAVVPPGAARDLVEGHEIGLAVDPGDVEGLARALAQIAGQPELRRRFRANIARIREQFSADRQARKWRDIALRIDSQDGEGASVVAEFHEGS